MPPSGLRITRATRKAFYVDAVRVTAGNMAAVAEWCDGIMLATLPEEGLKRYVKVPVVDAKNERQRRAYVNDWVLKADSGFKVYTHRAWTNGFDEVGDAACGLTTTTLDNQPCVLNHKHREASVLNGCRSFNDYIELVKRVVNHPMEWQ